MALTQEKKEEGERKKREQEDKDFDSSFDFLTQLSDYFITSAPGLSSLGIGQRSKPHQETPIFAPLLRSVAPPRQTVRSKKPFDFFGTLFSTPGTSELNPIALLNETV